MQFTVPQFIEHEPKVVGPMTLRQFLFIGVAVAVIFTMYFTFGKTKFLIFFFLSMVIGGGAVSLAFVKVNEKSLPALILSIFSFSMKPKIYLWHKKENPIKMIKLNKAKPLDKKEPEGESLKLVTKSKLKNLANQIDTR